MKHIIQQIAQELVEKIIKKAYSGKISDIDVLTENVLADCKASAAKVVEVILSEMNNQIRQDKQARRELGLVMKEKDRPRSLLTKLGTLHIARDYYYDKVNEKYISILDKAVGIPEYERIAGGVSAELVSLATEVSYAKSAHQRNAAALFSFCFLRLLKVDMILICKNMQLLYHALFFCRILVIPHLL